MFWNFLNRYLVLKIMRSLVAATVLIVLLFLVRYFIKVIPGKQNAVRNLYLRTYLWLLLLPAPFMGGLRLSLEYGHLRSHLYVVLYSYIMNRDFPFFIYMGGMILAASLLAVRRCRLARWVRRLPAVGNDSAYRTEMDGIFRELGDIGPRTEIRICNLVITPFTTGLFRPKIILPRYMLEEFDEHELVIILRHEFCHIRHGHLFLYALLDLFRVLWFINPLVHLCARKIKEDLEMVCDVAVMRENTCTPERYGRVLVKSMTASDQIYGGRRAGKGVPAFVGNKSFAVMRERISQIALYEAHMEPAKRRLRIMAAAGVAALFVLVILGSYPPYTEYQDYTLYTYRGMKALIQNNAAFDAAIRKTEDGLEIDNAAVRALIQKAGDRSGEERYWIYFGGYMKLPGIGGGGDVVLYEPSGVTEEKTLVPYNPHDKLGSFLDWIMKHV